MGKMRHRLNDLDGSYCGVDATQNWVDFYLWDRLLDAHPVQAILELGTAWGGFSLFLSHQAQARGLRFRTFDSVDHRTAGSDETFGAKLARAADLGEQFVCVDVLQEPDVVTRELLGCRVALLCDNGNKSKEVNLFAPTLALGSICVVHDWLTEIWPKDIPDCLGEAHGDLYDELGSASRAFIRR